MLKRAFCVSFKEEPILVPNKMCNAQLRSKNLEIFRNSKFVLDYADFIVVCIQSKLEMGTPTVRKCVFYTAET